MSYGKISRACSAGLLAASLLVAGSAPAGAAEKGPKSLWSWMMERWTSVVLAPWQSAETPGSGDGDWIKAGPGIDPNGGTVPQPGSPTGTACQGCGGSDSGAGAGGNL